MAGDTLPSKLKEQSYISMHTGLRMIVVELSSPNYADFTLLTADPLSAAVKCFLRILHLVQDTVLALSGNRIGSAEADVVPTNSIDDRVHVAE